MVDFPGPITLLGDSELLSAADMGRVVHALELIFGQELRIVKVNFTPGGGHRRHDSSAPELQGTSNA
jgi:hypothetical protein